MIPPAALTAAMSSLPSVLRGEAPELTLAALLQPVNADTPKGEKLLVCFSNGLGKSRIVTAVYYLPKTLDAAGEEWDEADEDGWAPEGWYEGSETHDDILRLRGEQTPIYWQPLPTTPAKAEGEKT